MKVYVSSSGWVEIHDPQENETHLQSFYNLKDVIEGKGFIVVQLNSGRIETYNRQMSLMGHRVIEEVDQIKAEEIITVIKKDGVTLKFDRSMNPLTVN